MKFHSFEWRFWFALAFSDLKFYSDIKKKYTINFHLFLIPNSKQTKQQQTNKKQTKNKTYQKNKQTNRKILFGQLDSEVWKHFQVL